MIDEKSIYSDPWAARRRVIAMALFVAWLAVVSFLSYTHLVWRDEVRALSAALQGDTAWAMVKGLRWEGHPAVWYLLLRTAHGLLPRPEVLLLVSVLVAAAAVLILVLRSPFSLPILGLLLIARFSVYEYSVVARDYGITMLVLFLFAAVYERHRDRDCLPGVLLFLLANCNTPSAILCSGLMVFWFVDILCRDDVNRARSMRMFWYNAALGVAGIAAAFFTIYPTLADGVVADHKPATWKTVLEGIFLPSLQFMDSYRLPGEDSLSPGLATALAVIQSLVLFGSTLGLIRRIGAFLAALITLVGFSCFFAVVYPGWYRHQALWFVFLVSMYWIARPGNAQAHAVLPARLQPLAGRLATVGTALFLVLLLLQAPYSMHQLLEAARSPLAMLKSRDNNLRSILAGRPELQQATIVADPDFLLETLPYYVSNPTYLLHEQRYGDIVHCTLHAKTELTLGDVLATAQRLRQDTGKPVLVLLSDEIGQTLPAQEYGDGYGWKLRITSDQARVFQASTHLLTHHVAPAKTDEGYYVYVLE